MSRGGIILALLVAGSLCIPRAIGAVPALEARYFDQAARAAYQRKDYSKALRYFLLVGSATTLGPGGLYNVAVTAELAKDNVLAFSYLEQYLATTDEDAERRADAVRRMSQLRQQLALVQITTEPPGATIYIDRRELGAYGKTPRTIPVDPGAHTIDVEMSGYVGKRLELIAEQGKQAPGHTRLEKRTGALRIDQDPPGAALAFSRDGRPLESIRVGELWVLPVGRCVITATSPGFRSTSIEWVVTEGKIAQIQLTAAKLPKPTGTLLVSSGSVVANVVVDGKARAVTPATLSGLSLGVHIIELKASGYLLWRRQVRVIKSSNQYLSATLRKSVGKSVD